MGEIESSADRQAKMEGRPFLVTGMIAGLELSRYCTEEEARKLLPSLQAILMGNPTCYDMRQPKPRPNIVAFEPRPAGTLQVMVPCLIKIEDGAIVSMIVDLTSDTNGILSDPTLVGATDPLAIDNTIDALVEIIKREPWPTPDVV